MAHVINTSASIKVLHPKINGQVHILRLVPKTIEEVSDEVLEFLENNPETPSGKFWAFWKSAGDFKVLGGDDPVPAEALAPKSLAEYGVEACVALIACEDDQEVLRTWLKNEKRKDVKTEIQARIKKLGK